LAKKPKKNKVGGTDKATIQANLRAAGLKPYKKNGVDENDPDWNDDLDEFVARSIPHQINDNGVTKTVSINLNTLVAKRGSNDEVIGWTYQED